MASNRGATRGQVTNTLGSVIGAQPGSLILGSSPIGGLQGSDMACIWRIGTFGSALYRDISLALANSRHENEFGDWRGWCSCV